eukprot:CAMPEP_0119283764 /NCGR_PEP_ID=MMETSP1329-20130426/29114_1 /TAXON_ID=114041 /ORGANISM="Genus nov. species nov., Strain RCC1024" /LENGTH=283 /DNA_ID=CAMNT_0007284439 /DNA_START=165 /DNA_END=1013 /DNA_ORIENTATION=+
MASQASIKSFFKPAPAKKQKTEDASDAGEKTGAARAAANLKEAKKKRALAFLKPIADDGWRAALEGEAGKSYLYELAQFVAKERRTQTVYPPEAQTFAALDACPLADVKVVIVGQDPYHGPGQAHGLAFSIADGADCKFPPSLRNIFAEAEADVAASLPPRPGGDLTPWASRGVLLLNSALTVRKGEANSHQKSGWADFTDAVVRAVNRRPGKGAVFVLWGKPAATKCASINTSKHRTITSSHPSPLSNTKTATPFTGSKVFSRINKLLVDELGWDAGVDWNL